MNITQNISTIGIDLGGTSIVGGVVNDRNIVRQSMALVPKGGSETEVVDKLCETIDSLLDETIEGIGIGVPSIVDIEQGIVYDVQNIPSWKEVHLKEIIERRFGIPVLVNNDANCFAIGEQLYGKGEKYKDIVALIVGTGLAAGIIIDNKLYKGHNSGAGEFGMIPYLDHNFEYYGCGQFFENVHGMKGTKVYELAKRGDNTALSMYREMGKHLGNAISAILYTYDPEIIILGGSVSQAYSFYKESLWESIGQLAYKPIIERLTIEISDQKDIAVLGASALYHSSRIAHSNIQNN